MIGIVVGAHTSGQHEVIARELSFYTHAARNPPGAGMNPVQRARNSRKRLPQAVLARDMGELVKQDRAPTVVGPFIGSGGKENRRTPYAEHCRHELIGLPE
jgi:hypothetical protein